MEPHGRHVIEKYLVNTSAVFKKVNAQQIICLNILVFLETRSIPQDAFLWDGYLSLANLVRCKCYLI